MVEHLGCEVPRYLRLSLACEIQPEEQGGEMAGARY
jgi:hypothetical protein